MIVFELNMAMFIAAMLSLPWLPFSLWDLARNWQNWSKSTFYIKNESNKWKAEKEEESVFSLWDSDIPLVPYGREKRKGERGALSKICVGTQIDEISKTSRSRDTLVSTFKESVPSISSPPPYSTYRIGHQLRRVIVFKSFASSGALCNRMGSIWAFDWNIISKHFLCSSCIIRAQSIWKIDLDLI